MSYFIFDIPNEIERLKTYGNVDEGLANQFLTDANNIITDVSEGMKFNIYNSFKNLITQMIQSRYQEKTIEQKITFFETNLEYIGMELRNFNPQNYRNKFFDNGIIVFESKRVFAKYLSDKIVILGQRGEGSNVGTIENGKVYVKQGYIVFFAKVLYDKYFIDGLLMQASKIIYIGGKPADISNFKRYEKFQKYNYDKKKLSEVKKFVEQNMDVFKEHFNS